jgi:hypothetical protein
MNEQSDDQQKFLDKINDLAREKALFKVTFSKQRHGNKEISQVYLRPVDIKHQLHYSLTYRYKTRDIVKNFLPEDVSEIVKELIDAQFHNAVLFTESEEWTLMESKKGRTALLIKKLASTNNIPTTHDQVKNRLIPENRPWLQALGLAGKDGKIYDKSQDKYRQINRFVELIDHLTAHIPQEASLQIADMGSGKGYLTFALYDHLVNNRKMRCRITGYDLKEEVIALCYNVAMKEGFVGLTFMKKSIEDVDCTGLDMVIALHACDIATDMAIASAIKASVQYIVVAPCCHKQIRKSMRHHNVLSPVMKHGILEERMAEMLTDGMRALLMEAHGYRTEVMEFISSEHTGKNLMITGTRGEASPAALIQYQELKKYFNISHHYLETLLDKK